MSQLVLFFSVKFLVEEEAEKPDERLLQELVQKSVKSALGTACFDDNDLFVEIMNHMEVKISLVQDFIYFSYRRDLNKKPPNTLGIRIMDSQIADSIVSAIQMPGKSLIFKWHQNCQVFRSQYE